MKALLEDILAPEGAIARRLGERYEFRPQQVEMAHLVPFPKAWTYCWWGTAIPQSTAA